MLALLALGGGFYLGSYRYTSAPGVLKLSLSDATTKLENAGVKIKKGTDEFSEDVGEGLVLRQNPQPGGRLRKGGAVTLVLSKGKDRRRVPRLAGTTVPAAQQAPRGRAGLSAVPTPSVTTATVPKGAGDPQRPRGRHEA